MSACDMHTLFVYRDRQLTSEKPVSMSKTFKVPSDDAEQQLLASPPGRNLHVGM